MHQNQEPANFSVSANPIPLNTWTQISVSLNRGGAPIIAFNGVQQSTAGSVRTGNINVASDLQIAHSASAISYFAGFIDDVRIYSRAISIAEIQAIYNAER